MTIPMLLPPYLLEAIAVRGSAEAARRAQLTLRHDAEIRAARAVGGAVVTPPLTTPQLGQPQRLIHDAEGGQELPGRVVRGEGDPATADQAVDEAYDGLGHTWQLYFDAFSRDSIDARGMPLLGTVHFGRDYANAFWDGQQMVFGDGDGDLFNRFTASIDVIGHELTHGVIEFAAGLRYQDQSGALNESICDVFGSLVRQWAQGQTAEQADWLIGAELFTDKVAGQALRSMAAPGTAYDDPVLGQDPQPAHMDDFVSTAEDSGGVHINSGIPNRAFYLVATAIGGRAWEAPGRIWYAALTDDRLRPDSDFAVFAHLTIEAAAGMGSAEVVRQAWSTVGIEPSPTLGQPATPPVAANTRLHLSRSGGFTGLGQERQFELSDLSDVDAGNWGRLVGGNALTDLSRVGDSTPDAFVYRLTCDQIPLDVQLPEPTLPAAVRELFHRTLRGSQ